MIIRNKQTGVDREVTPAEYAAICARGEAWKLMYEIIEAKEPTLPKEVKNIVRKQKPEFANDGFEAIDGGVPQQDAGEIQ